MGHRILKRVPMDFNWPLNKIWKGYTNPYPGPVQCKHCDGSGLNSASRQISDDFYDNDGCGVRWHYEYGVAPNGTKAKRPPWKIIGETRRWCNDITQDEVIALIKKDRLRDFTHGWIADKGWTLKTWDTNGFYCPSCHTSVPQLSEEHHSCICTGCDRECLLLDKNDWRLYIPSAEEVNANESKCGLGGHDGFNRWILIEARCKRLGIWGNCRICKGYDVKFPPRVSRRKYKSWRQYEPPTGSGFQLWETCSEGSPVSPVCLTIYDLAEWCERNATTFGSEKASFRVWYKMFHDEVHGDIPGSVDAGSLLIMTRGYIGSAANMQADV